MTDLEAAEARYAEALGDLKQKIEVLARVFNAAVAVRNRWEQYKDAPQWAPAKEQNMRALMDALRAALDPDGVPR